nr:unnamed protein product [Naegleria fowleri]
MEPQPSSSSVVTMVPASSSLIGGDDQMPLSSSSSSNSPSSLALPSSSPPPPSNSSLIQPPMSSSQSGTIPSSLSNNQQQPSSFLNNNTAMNRPEEASSTMPNISSQDFAASSSMANHNTSNGQRESAHPTATSPIGVPLSSSATQNKPLNDFENIYACFKKRNREQYEQNSNLSATSSSTTESYVKDLEDKVDFMAQLITIQSAKMRKMEVRLRKLESLLPQTGDEFVNSSNLHRIPMMTSSSHGGANIDEISTISDDLPTFAATPKKEKGNRQPNAYNIFMKSEIQRIRTTHTELTQKQAFKLAANNWSLKKAEIMAAQKKGIDPMTLVTGGSSTDLKAGSSAVNTPSDTTIPDNLSSGTPAILENEK